MASGERSWQGEILEEGLRACWFFREVIIQKDVSVKEQLKSFPSAAVEAIRSRKSQYAHFALLRARSKEKAFAPVVYRENSHGPLVILCA